MSAAFIGCKISLISKSEIRYEGILYTIDTKESTIALAKVRSFGTEDRQTDKPVAPRNEVYEYIIFRASDIKDLIVDDPPATSPGLSDPAIIQAQSVGASSTIPGSTAPPSVSTAQGPKSHLSTVLASATNNHSANIAAASRGSTPPVAKPASPNHEKEQRRQPNAGQNRENRQTQQRNDNRGRLNNQGQQRGQPRANHQVNQRGGFYQNQNFGGRGRQQQGRAPFQQRQPGHQFGGFNQRRGQNFARAPRTDVTKLDDYDFEKANQEFTELEKGISGLDVNDKPSDVENAENDNELESGEVAYDKQKSFFDAISCEALERSKGNVQKVDRRQERKLNEETFGVGGVRTYRPRGFGRGGYHNHRGYGVRNYNQRGNWNNNRRGGDQRRPNDSGQPAETRKPAAPVEA